MIERMYCFEKLVGEDSTSQNNITLHSSNELLKSYNWLVFTDSRGLERECDTNINDTWVYKICNYLHEINQSFLVISRPKNLTTFSTLVNFLRLNNIKFEGLVTNVGFVDCTPKKDSAINDIKLQIKDYSISEQREVIFNPYKLSDGRVEQLSSIVFNESTIFDIKDILRRYFFKKIIIKTPRIPRVKEFQRKRPFEFYKQIDETNILIDKISSGSNTTTIDFLENSIETFDGVHFTAKDHFIVYKLLKRAIKNNMHGNHLSNAISTHT